MAESSKTIKALRDEGLELARKAQAVFAAPDDHTPEEIEEARTWHNDSVAIADRIDQSLKARPDVKALGDRWAAFNTPDRPYLGGSGGDGGVHSRGHDGFAIGPDGQPVMMVGTPAKSLGMALIESAACKAFSPKTEHKEVGLYLPDQWLPNYGNHLKATLTTGVTGFTSYQYVPGIIPVEQQRLTIADLMPNGQTNAGSIRYWQEDSYANAATTVAEEGLKPEASWDLSEQTANVRKIAVRGRVSDEAFEDFPQLQGYVDGRLRFMVGEREEVQLLNGDAAGSNLRGLLQTTGVQTEAAGAVTATNTALDAIYRAITKVRTVGRFEPDGVVVHPTDYQIFRLTRDGNGQYLGGGPFFGAYGQGGVAVQPGPWGLRPVITTAIAAGTSLVGAWRLGAMIFRRAGINVAMTNSNEDDFNFNRVSIRVEERLGLVVWRPLAFCRVTGIAA